MIRKIISNKVANKKNGYKKNPKRREKYVREKCASPHPRLYLPPPSHWVSKDAIKTSQLETNKMSSPCSSWHNSNDNGTSFRVLDNVRLVFGSYWASVLISVLKPGEDNRKSVSISDARVGVFLSKMKENADRAQAAEYEFKDRKIWNETL